MEKPGSADLTRPQTPILLVSDGLVHPSLAGRFWLRRALAALPGYRLRHAASLEVLSRLPPASYAAIVLYVHQSSLSAAALAGLEGLLEAGGGLLAVHSASASFKEEPRYYELLGGQFVRHGPIEEFLVQPASPQDEAFAGIPEFTVRDELYRHEYDATNRILFHTVVDGEREPVVWTRRWGPGRVCYCSLGHTVSSMRHPQVWQILQRGLAWASQGQDR
jgi:type 1 glutamine amidotransferase